MTLRFPVAVLGALMLATGCSSEPETPAGLPAGPTPEGTAGAGAFLVARDTELEYAESLSEGRLSDACTEAGIVALSYESASQPVEAARWKTTADSTCAAFEARADTITEALAGPEVDGSDG